MQSFWISSRSSLKRASSRIHWGKHASLSCHSLSVRLGVMSVRWTEPRKDGPRRIDRPQNGLLNLRDVHELLARADSRRIMNAMRVRR